MTLTRAAGRVSLSSIIVMIFVCATLSDSCGGSAEKGSPAGPSGTGGPSGSSSSSGSGTAAAICRTYPTSATVVTTLQNGATQNGSLSGAFDSSANRATVTTLGPNGGVCTTSVSTYRSTGDFVDEVKVIPGMSQQTSTMTTNGPACGGVTSTVNYTYDGSGRLTSTTSTALGVSSSTTYTAWDSSGRPTAGSFPGTTIANSYNDATRTWVQTLTPTRGGSSTTTMTYDADGNQVTVLNVSGNSRTTTTFNNTATARVCK
jgi:hypothetical protein